MAQLKGPPRLLVVTGLSGAGKTTVLKILEDEGWEAVDNLPLSLLPRLADMDAPATRPIAAGIDSRTRGFAPDALIGALQQLRARGVDVRLLFLDCANDVLHNRFTATRRVHPLAADRPVMDGIRIERELMHAVRAAADEAIDTSESRLPDLRARIVREYGEDDDRAMVVSVLSFSYRLGLPRDADLVFDMRFLRNPYYEAALKDMSGMDAPVADYVAGDAAFPPFFAAFSGLILSLLPAYVGAGKKYLTIALGCTGGRHRSVFVAERLAASLGAAGWRPVLRHRDIGVGGG